MARRSPASLPGHAPSPAWNALFPAREHIEAAALIQQVRYFENLEQCGGQQKVHISGRRHQSS
jgi:hypothetical protein